MDDVGVGNDDTNGKNDALTGMQNEWENSHVQPLKNVSVLSSPKQSFASVVSHEKNHKVVNFRALFNPEKMDNYDFVLPLETIQDVKHKFENSIVGYFVGKSVAFPLVKSYEVTITVPYEDGSGYSKEHIKVKYNWRPPLCLDCYVFGHTLKQCPKRVVVAPITVEATQVAPSDRFTTVTTKKRNKGKNQNGWNMKKPNGVKVINPNSSSYYHPVANNTANKNRELSRKNTNEENNNGVKLKNLFEKLNEITSIFDPEGKTGESNIFSESESKDNQNNEHSDSKVEENIRGLNRDPKQSEVRQVVNENQLSVCVILESHVNLSTLSTVCSRVFCSWDWTSNANLFTKGYRIILGWNIDVVNVMVLSQTNQAMHVKPKGGRGKLKKLDRIKGNLDFLDTFSSAYAIFQPYWISDHSPVVLKILNLAMNKPKPFKFFNFITFKSKFYDVVASQWKMNVLGHAMFQVVSKMKALKKPFRKLVNDHGNLHDHVNKLRHELDEVQKALDHNPNDAVLREKEVVYVKAFAEAKIDEERFLKRKAKVEWLEVGDSNSSYFHKTVKSRNQRSRIEVIRDANNVEVMGSLVADAFVSHYHQFIGTTMDCDELVMQGLFEKKVSDTSNLNMIRNITDEEIKAAMFSIGDDRAPGPDGYTSAFFKKKKTMEVFMDDFLVLGDSFSSCLSHLDNMLQRCILVAVDYLSKWVEAKVLPTYDSRVVVKFLKSLFARFETPRAIISDFGTHFYNDKFSKVMSKYGVTHRLAIVYHPQTSGQVEVSNRGLKRSLERTIGENHTSCSEKLDDALWAFRTGYKTPIGCTPYKFVYKKSCHLPIELEHKAYWALKHVNFDLKTAGDHWKLQLNELNELRDQAYENSLTYREKTKKLHDSKIKNRLFNVGDRVLLFNSCLKIFSEKLKTRWLGSLPSPKFFHMEPLSYLNRMIQTLR
nr:reverse transcriptase domain-containing protein [Tanacetum cinerariifolium]